MMFRCNKRSSKLLVYAVASFLLLYIPFNLMYLLLSSHLTQTNNGDTNRLSRHAETFPVRLKQLVPLPDGNVDMVLSMNLKELFKIMDGVLQTSLNKEFTTNPPPMNTSFLLHNPLACSGIPDLQYVVYVHTAPANKARRNVIRSTWASDTLFRNQKSKLVFMMGTSPKMEDQRQIQEEHTLYGDIVQGDFLEHYKNLTLKAIMGLKWVAQYCKQAAFAIKADDDAFVNIFRIWEMLENNKHMKRLILCPLWTDNTQPILRDPSKCMKWCVSYTEFPGRAYFPQYCAGLTYVISREIIPELYRASFSTPFFWIDDVYVTGTLTPKVPRIQYIDIHKNITLAQDFMVNQYQAKGPVTLLVSHVKTISKFYSLWNSTLDRLSKRELTSLGDSVFAGYPHLREKLQTLVRTTRNPPKKT